MEQCFVCRMCKEIKRAGTLVSPPTKWAEQRPTHSCKSLVLMEICLSTSGFFMHLCAFVIFSATFRCERTRRNESDNKSRPDHQMRSARQSCTRSEVVEKWATLRLCSGSFQSQQPLRSRDGSQTDGRWSVHLFRTQ